MARPSFDALRDLARLVKRGLPKRSQYISMLRHQDMSDLTGRLFHALTDSPERSEEAIAREVFGVKASTQGTSYQAHKSRIKQLLLNTLFVLDLDKAGYTELTKKKRWNDRDEFLAKQIYALGPDPLAESIADAGLRNAVEVEDWHNALAFAKILRSIATYAGQEKKRRKYAEEYERLLEILHAEERGRAAYEEILCAFTLTGGEKYEMAKVAECALPEINAAYEKFQTFGLARLQFELKTAAFQARQNYRDSLGAGNEYEALLTGRFKTFANRDNLNELAFHRLKCHQQLRHYDEAARALEQCKSLVPRGNENWFYLEEQRFLLATHTARFEDARSVLDGTRNHKRFPLLAEAIRERWQIFGVHLDIAQGRFPKFHNVEELLKFLRIYSGDKSGFNASMLLMQILLLIERKASTRLVSERIERLRKYRDRYLREAGSEQASLLFEIIDLLGKDLNRPRAMLEESADLIEAFKTADSYPLDGIQILPYLWYWARMEPALRRYS